MRFHDYAEAQTTAALRALITRGTEPALGEIEALRVAFDVRFEAVRGALEGPQCIDPAWLQEVIDQLAHAADQEAEDAARASRRQVLAEVQVRWEFERAEAEKCLELVRAEAAAHREADRLAHAALTEALEQARAQVDAIRTDAAAQLEAGRAAQTQLLEETHAQIQAAQVDSERAVTAERSVTEDIRAHLEEARAEVEQAHAERDRVENAAQAQRRESLERLAQDLSRAAAERAEAAATCARLETQEAAETQLAAAWAEAQTRLQAQRATNAALLDATIEEARQRVHTIQTAAEAEIQSVRAEFEARLGLEQAAKTELATALAEAQQRAAAATWNDAQARAASLEAAHARLQALDGERTQMKQARDEAEARLDAETRSRTGLVEGLQAARHAANVAQAETEAYRDQMQAADRHIRVLEEAHSKLTLEADAQARALADARDAGDASMAPLDRVRSALQAFGTVTSKRDLVETLVAQLSHEFARVALFVVRRNRLEGSLSRGLDPTTDIRNIAIPLMIESPLTRAVTSKTLATLATGADGVKIGLFGSPVECAMAWPVLADGQVIAVAYAEHPPELPGGRAGGGQKIAEILTDHVSRRLTGRRPASSARPVGGRDILGAADAPPQAEAPRAHPSPTRHARRVKIQEGTEVLVDGSASVLVDLSPLGAQVLSPTVVRPNRSVRFSLPFEDGELPCKARVVWAAFEQSRGGGPVWYRAGVKFTEVDTTAVETFPIEHSIADDVKKAAAE